MADQKPIHDGDRHEKRDINVGKVALVGVVLLGLIALVGHFVPWFLFDFMATRTEDQGPPPTPLLNADQTPPPPRLQVHAPADLAKLRADEDTRLNGYSWVDRANGVVRIPIRRAMTLMAERGLGSPAPTNAQSTSGRLPSGAVPVGK